MREVALYEAKNSLSALVAEVEATGAEIVITRHGKPAARLSPVKAQRTAEEMSALGAFLNTHLYDMAAKHPETAAPLSWEQLKADMYPEDED